MPLTTMNRADFRESARKVLMTAQLIASFTPTNKDDQFVALLAGAVMSDDQFSRLCDLLGIPE